MEGKYFESHGIRMWYQVMGAGQPLVFLHGYGITAKLHQELLEPLAREYQIFVPDLPGFGKSSTPPSSWEFNDYAQLISRFIKQRNLKNYLLIGYSFGGAVAQLVANSDPGVKKLVLISSAGISPQLPWWKILYITSVLKPYHDYSFYKNQKVLAQVRKELIKNLFKRIWHIPRIISIILRIISSDIPLGQPITVETLIIAAKNDEYFSLANQDKLASRISTHTLKIIDEYHDWLLFKPQLFLEIFKKSGSINEA